MTRGWIDLLMTANGTHCPLALDEHEVDRARRDSDYTKVDVIGAGLAGTTLALALQKQGFDCRLWESRPSDAPQINSGVILTPNGLRCLDHLGVLERIKDRCWIASYRTFADDEDRITKRTLIADDQRYGYKNHRIWRTLLLNELKLMLKELSIPVTYNARLTAIDNDAASGVTFRINGVQQHTQLLVGADGIYSTVRRHITAVEPEYTGVIGILTHIPSSSVDWPTPDFMQCTIQPRVGGVSPIFMIPEDVHASQVMVGMQTQLPTFARADWERLAKDKDRIVDIFRQGYESRRGVSRQIVDAVSARKEELFLWPFLRMPTLERWYSETGNVMFLGDAAHALPPSSGQGVNQALEDVYALTLALRKSKPRLATLKFWQAARQERVDAVFDWATNVQNVQRMSAAEKEKLVQAGKIKDLSDPGAESMGWLYNWDIAKQLDQWADELQ